MNGPLRLQRTFFKAHGHGNDYLVFPEGGDWALTSGAVRRVCDRWRGVGGDGIVVLLRARGGEGVAGAALPDARNGSAPGFPDLLPSVPPFRLRMFNPDGSEFERSGNGLRVLGSYLYSRGWVELGVGFPVEVGGDRVEMTILEERVDGELDVAVEMGRARFGLQAVGGGGDGPGRPGIGGPTGEPLDVQPVSVGNPHCVVFREALPEEDLLELGPWLTRHPAFPSGTNVQLARVLGEQRVRILIWERGVGRTASSGTSACAVAAACVHRGRLSPGVVQVEMEGGVFRVTVREGGEVRLEGPVRRVMAGDLDPAFLEELRGL